MKDVTRRIVAMT